MSKIKMHSNDSIRNLTEVMVNSCGIDRSQANAAVNAIERSKHNQFGTVGQVKKAVETEEGRKALLDILHLGPKRLGYLMRTFDEVEVTPLEELVEETIPNNERTEIMDYFIDEHGILHEELGLPLDKPAPEEEKAITKLKRSTIGRVTINLKVPIHGDDTIDICSDYLASRLISGHLFFTEDYLDNTDDVIHPVGLKIVDNDEFMPGFVRVSTESGYSVTIAKDSILMIETEMFPVEE